MKFDVAWRLGSCRTASPRLTLSNRRNLGASHVGDAAADQEIIFLPNGALFASAAVVAADAQDRSSVAATRPNCGYDPKFAAFMKGCLQG